MARFAISGGESAQVVFIDRSADGYRAIAQEQAVLCVVFGKEFKDVSTTFVEAGLSLIRL